jgi:hypothetical protein
MNPAPPIFTRTPVGQVQPFYEHHDSLPVFRPIGRGFEHLHCPLDGRLVRHKARARDRAFRHPVDGARVEVAETAVHSRLDVEDGESFGLPPLEVEGVLVVVPRDVFADADGPEQRQGRLEGGGSAPVSIATSKRLRCASRP